MRRISTTVIGIAQGDQEVFSEFFDGGAMWTGDGPRDRRQNVRFETPFLQPPVVHVGLSMLDVDSTRNLRTEAAAEHITERGFDLVFRTWGDSRVARIRMNWIAIGALRHADDWDV